MRRRSTWGIPAVFLALASLSLLAAPAPGKDKAAKKKKAGLLIAHTVKEIGLTVKFNSDWLVEQEVTKKGGNVYQRVADTGGLVFVRYGKNTYDQEETVDNFKAVLVDMLRTVTVKSDKKIKFCGKSARRAVLLQKKKAVRVYLEDDEGQIVDKEEPEETTVIVVIGFRVKGIPVLVGYRMPEQHLEAWKAVLEEIIASVSLAKPAGSTGSEKK